jgi:pyruvate dehydrogenase E2 component (dihydrolipoamide acetyltransferase)
MADVKDILVPDIGDFEGVEVIEIIVSPGDTISIEDPLVSLESDKAAMEIPSEYAGTIKEIKVSMGDTVSQGDLLLTMEVIESAPKEVKSEEPTKYENTQAQISTATKKSPAKKPAPAPVRRPPVTMGPIDEASFRKAYASPSVRKFARELGADLGRISGSGNKNRILKDDVKAFVKQILTSGHGGGSGIDVAPMPEIDFSQFGEIEIQSLTKINKLTGQFLHRNWITVPHVTQFDETDITNLEAFRKQLNNKHKGEGFKVTVLAFLVKALATALKEFPRLNASLDTTGENLVMKKYFHIGIAVDTPAGLVVPVIRDVDKKSLIDIGQELIATGRKARDKKLSPADMSGGCMSISSLGGIGGTAFTPIVNAPEVAILGVSRASMKPVYIDGEFVPRLMLPLSLSYDHRVVDGAVGARFTAFLSKVLSGNPENLL